MTRYWLVKQEPTSYNWTKFEREGETEWDGVHNALALRYVREMAVGDLAIFYHSGDERSCVGVLRVVRGPRADPNDPRGSWSVKVRPVRPLRRPVSIAEIRSDPGFSGFELLRFSRLSVMPVSSEHWKRILRLSDEDPGSDNRVVTAGRRGPARTTAPRRPAGAARRTR